MAIFCQLAPWVALEAFAAVRGLVTKLQSTARKSWHNIVFCTLVWEDSLLIEFLTIYNGQKPSFIKSYSFHTQLGDQVICTITLFDGDDYAADSAHVTLRVAKTGRSTKTLSYANARMAMCWTKAILTRALSIRLFVATLLANREDSIPLLKAS